MGGCTHRDPVPLHRLKGIIRRQDICHHGGGAIIVAAQAARGPLKRMTATEHYVQEDADAPHVDGLIIGL